MRILADDPEAFAAFVNSTAGWQAVALDHLAPAERLLWRELGGGTRAYATETPSGESFWSRLYLLTTAPTSQFDVLRRHLATMPAPPARVACLALRGSGFHGHRGRRWESAAGNLHLSVGLLPSGSARRLGLALTMLPAVAVLDAIVAVSAGALRPGIKWVNDILLDGRKIAGVLTATQARGGSLDLAVLGVGLNIATAPAVPASPFVPAVGCLLEAAGGEALTLPALYWAVLDALALRYRGLLHQGPEELFAAYRSACNVIGRHVCVWEEGLDEGAPPDEWPAPLARGIVLDVAPDLSLRLDSQTEPVSKGRLAFAEACPPPWCRRPI